MLKINNKQQDQHNKCAQIRDLENRPVLTLVNCHQNFLGCATQKMQYKSCAVKPLKFTIQRTAPLPQRQSEDQHGMVKTSDMKKDDQTLL